MVVGSSPISSAKFFLGDEMFKEKTKYKCVECKGDTFTELFDFEKINGGIIVKKKETICLSCVKKKGMKILISISPLSSAWTERSATDGKVGSLNLSEGTKIKKGEF